MDASLRVVHFLNQFFAGLGGEEAANLPVEVRREPVGATRALVAALGGQATVVGAFSCTVSAATPPSSAAAGASEGASSASRNGVLPNASWTSWAKSSDDNCSRRTACCSRGVSV